MNFILFHAYNFWLSTQRQQKKERELRELAFQSEINALRAQIEPHFLFNTLNSISASVPPTLEKTRVLIAQLADTFRYALRVSVSQFVALGDEIDFLKTWLALEKQRFGERLAIDYQIDANAVGVMVPPMILQPLVENALNHGIAPKIDGGTVTIQCEVRNEWVYVAVSDTGVGYTGDLKEILYKSVGLSNISKRLKLLYNQSLQVELQQEGLRFSFTIPLK
jgi:LytS/YehU family sensor histidine kinase